MGERELRRARRKVERSTPQQPPRLPGWLVRQNWRKQRVTEGQRKKIAEVAQFDTDSDNENLTLVEGKMGTPVWASYQREEREICLQ